MKYHSKIQISPCEFTKPKADGVNIRILIIINFRIMARQKSIFKIEGTIADVTFYKSKDGYLVREKGGITSERYRNDPNFQRTRENSSEFGRAGKAGKTLRNSLRSLLKDVADYRMTSRLTQQMMKVIQLDSTSTRGQRNVIDGETELLKGFDFNQNAKLNNCFFAPYTITLNRATGEAKAALTSFIPTDAIAIPEAATHYKIVTAATAVDFEAETFVSVEKSSDILPINTSASPELELDNQLPTDLSQPLFYVLGISFYQEVNGEMYLLKNGAYNALQIVKVVGV